MKRILNAISTLIIVLFVSTSGMAQTILTIDNQQVSVNEFKRIYLRNNSDSVITQASLNEYIQLFINFKLKVMEAQEAGLDTTAAFKTELNGYRQQLAKSYLTDHKVTDALVKEAYERMGEEVNASHILIKLNKNANAVDTLIAWEKAIKISTRIAKGEDFDTVAKETSDDPQAKTQGGSLGWFSAFRMVYAFESAAYKLKKGEISKPVRTQFGYHIIRLNDKRKERGQVQAAHIMIIASKNADEGKIAVAKERINSVYAELVAGKPFKELAKLYSEDKYSAQKGGDLGWFSSGRYVPEFENAAFTLANNGDFSEPIQTPAGFHVIMRSGRKQLEPFDKMEEEIRQKLARDSRSTVSKDALLNKLKAAYNYALIDTSKYLLEKLDDSVFSGKWNAQVAAAIKQPICKFAGSTKTHYDFAQYLQNNGRAFKKMLFDILLETAYDGFVNESILEYEESRLEEKYDDFKFLMKEYHDGIILFELTDKLIWSKAVQDSTGLENFHKKSAGNYMHPKRIRAVIFSTSTDNDKKSLIKLLSKQKRKSFNPEEITKKINENKKNSVSVIYNQKFEKTDNTMIDLIFDEKLAIENKIAVVSDSKNVIYVTEIIPPQPKELNTIRGVVISDYQDYLEKEWIKQLRKKYKTKVDKDILYSLVGTK